MKSARTSTSVIVFAATAVLAVISAGYSEAGQRGVPVGLLQSVAQLDDVALVEMPEVDVETYLAEDAARERTGEPAPQRFAAGMELSLTPADAGTRETLADGSSLWRLRLRSPGALNLNLHFDRFSPAPGASLWLYDPDGAVAQGPYTSADRNIAGELWTAIVPGDEVVVELHEPAGAAAASDIRIAAVNHGYRDVGVRTGEAEPKQGSCNVDVICPEGDGWRDQIRSVAKITILGAYLCSGQLLNNTAEDGTPYFLTAQHCVEYASEAPSVVVFWNFESAVCGQLAGGDPTQNQSGATLVSTWAWQTGSDFTLLLLDEVPDPDFDVYYSGWDASGSIPPGSVGIHHPNGDEKAISFNNDPLAMDNYYGHGSHQWRISEWEVGTTEGGSSGSCIFHPTSKRCVGTLTAGTASCANPSGYDIYGRMDAHWLGNGTADSRLVDWLDPLASGALTLDGRNPVVSPPEASFTYSPASPAAGSPVTFTDTSTGNPTTWVWNFGDGGTSTTQNPVHTFSNSGTFTVSLTVSNASGSSSVSKDVDVSLGGSLSDAYYVAAAALTAGLEGSFFQTDIDINNASNFMAQYAFVWLPRGENNSSPTASGTYTLAAGASNRYENVLSEVFGLEPDVAGALIVYSNTDDLVIMSRTYNLPTAKVSGTFGQAIPGIPESELIGQNDVRRIVFMSENDDLRANVGCVNGVNDNVPIKIELYRANGTLLATRTMALAPWSNNQFNQVFADYAPTNGYVDVSSIKANAGFYCYGSVLDNGSSDPTTVLPR